MTGVALTGIGEAADLIEAEAEDTKIPPYSVPVNTHRRLINHRRALAQISMKNVGGQD